MLKGRCSHFQHSIEIISIGNNIFLLNATFILDKHPKYITRFCDGMAAIVLTSFHPVELLRSRRNAIFRKQNKIYISGMWYFWLILNRASNPNNHYHDFKLVNAIFNNIHLLPEVLTCCWPSGYLYKPIWFSYYALKIWK